MSMSKSKDANYFVYCMTYTSERLDLEGLRGVEDQDVFAVEYRDICAVASECENFEYEPKEETVEKFHEVIKDVMDQQTVVPMAFGMVFKKEPILKNVMMASEKAIKKALNKFEGKIELGVKLLHPSGEETDSEVLDDIFERLDRKAVSSTKGDLFSDRLALNASFLIDEGDLDDFSDAVGEIDEEFEDMKIRYTGPYPPFNFVDIDIKAGGG